MKNLLYILLATLFISCQPRYEAAITTNEIDAHIRYMASEELKGRYPGTPEDKELGAYLSGEFKNAGLELYQGTGLQYFSIVTDLVLLPDNSFTAGEFTAEVENDFTPLSFSASAKLNSELVFCGYGFRNDAGPNGWDDYKDMDLEGKWVMVLRGVPGKQTSSSPWVNFSKDRDKALLASDLGAGGVIFVSGYSYAAKDELEKLKGKQHPLSIPVIQMSRSAAEELLAVAGKDSLAILEDQLIEASAPASFATGLEVEITTGLKPAEVETYNSIAILAGRDKDLMNEYVVIGGHHDHLGMGGEGTSSRQPDTVAVHYGADDNASGVSAVLEIAEHFAATPARRSMVFTTFGAEEMGLVGSRFLAENPPVDLDQVQAMINVDMLGRLNEDRQLQIGGVGTSPELQAILDSVNQDYGFSIKYSNEGYGPSDHASFYAKDVPVLFISTGAHPDYHTPNDRAGLINLEGSREIFEFVADVAGCLADHTEKLVFTEAGPKVRASSRGRHGGVTLGLMPDVTYEGNEGMPVMFVTEGKPAAIGGIMKGDIIITIDGLNVGNVQDYMSRLGGLKEGQAVVVKVKRDEDILEILVTI